MASSDIQTGYATNIIPWLAHATLDVFGLAGGNGLLAEWNTADLDRYLGFGAQFDTLQHDSENEFLAAVTQIVREAQEVTILKAGRYFMPIFRIIGTLTALSHLLPQLTYFVLAKIRKKCSKDEKRLIPLRKWACS
jgi:hypothetical protein